ncbi:hypothetical protein AV650_14375 [Serratia fonticola]|uniref:DUF5347 family protein n=1 Tax=Serratia fonticola TaxID=47917 RepID=UPI000742F462|nr:DUF5347 family protein [Serratia fonticola]ALX94666.1 hypothetical protein AV650_14375 [Serratia fonticola]
MSARVIELTPEEIHRGLINSKKARLLIADAMKRNNRLVRFFNNISTRHKGLIYYCANIKKERHKIQFSDLTEQERIAVVSAMSDLKSLTDSFPRSLSEADSVIK